jgi:ADP-heptose:LPS heptosyltransferase
LQGGPPVADRILLIRLGAVGDVVRTLPAASALSAAYPNARITWLVEPAAAALPAAQPFIDDVLTFPRGDLQALLRAGALGPLARAFGEFARVLRRRRFDLVVDFHSILRSALMSRLSGAPVRVAYAPPFGREGSHLLANRLLALPAHRISRFERNAALVRFLGAPFDPAEQPLAIPREARARSERAFSGRPAPVALHPGTSAATPYKRYPAAHFAAVARLLADECGLRCVVTRGASPAEADSAREVVALSRGAAELAPATPSLLDLAAVFASSRLAIASDTGPLHLAALAGTPVLQLLGPTDPVENAPWERAHARSLRAGLACSPCRRGCAAAPCMQAIEPASVVAAARELLAEPRADAAAGGAGRWT